ncbi:MAG: DNA-processing protein DprA [Hyphomicrobium sp.]|nr:DNA-processing protein DprA [Hyphomicrobium sp.]
MAELERASALGARPLFTIEPGYPALLAHLDVPPPLVYAKGDIGRLQRPAIAIVGSRLASAAGLAFARRVAVDLAAAGYVTVSGLARGIDAAVHDATLETGTIAVLAGGIDFIYPPENARLHEEIGRRGCLLTEMPPGFEPRARDFPRRNRLISGLSRGVVVVEAAERSGTLVTARMAAEQGREVFAVPGHPLDPRAAGTNNLIRNGATLVMSADDILAELAPIVGAGHGAHEAPDRYATGVTSVPEDRAVDLTPPPLPPAAPTDGDRNEILRLLGPSPITTDDLARAAKIDARQLRAVLMELDLAGRIERHGLGLVSLRLTSPATLQDAHRT